MDAFGGTGVESYYAKLNGKQVFYNDVLKFNYQIESAIIENGCIKLGDEEIDFLIRRHEEVKYSDFIRRMFKGLYYMDEENYQLDVIVYEYKCI